MILFVVCGFSTFSCCAAGDSVPDRLHMLLCLFWIGAWNIRLYIESCRHVIVYPRGLFCLYMSFCDRLRCLTIFAVQCFHWMSAETDRSMGTEVIFLITSLYYNVCMVCWIKDLKCYFYLEVLQGRMLKYSLFCCLSMLVGWKRSCGSVFI